jgi:2-amino-4-hydroxy-6-hydroxymethyldihydropteridine diphosphokinase
MSSTTNYQVTTTNSHLAAIALGSNLPSAHGAPEQNLLAAIERIRTLGRIVAVSSFHATAPVGYLDQPNFVNAALLLETTLGPLPLLHTLLAIELAMGRIRANVPPKGPRIIDLDLLFVDQIVLNIPDLTLPHPALPDRAFVLLPLAEIAPTWTHPQTGQTIQAMLDAL